MEIKDLTSEQLAKISQEVPSWMAKHRPDWMADNRPEWMAENRPGSVMPGSMMVESPKVPQHILDVLDIL